MGRRGHADLLKYLGRRIGGLRCLLLLSLRDDEVGADHPLVQVLGDLATATVVRIALPPLSPDGVAQLARLAGYSAADLHRITAGNPFFVTELLHSPKLPAGSVPASVRDAVWARLSRLSPAEREALELASTVPGRIERWLLQALVGAAADTLLDSCVEHGVLLSMDDAAVTFRHELAGQATLSRLSEPAQRLAHARVYAPLVQARPSGASVPLSCLLHHAAAAGDGAAVLGLATEAAAQAARLGAHQQAAAHLATALRFVDQAPTALAAQINEDWAYEAGVSLRIDDAGDRELGAATELPPSRRGPYARARSHPLGLTQREVEVLALVAEGLSNAQIAQRLSRSARTVEHHVSALLTKLGAANRAEALGRLRREPGLLQPADSASEN